MCGIAGFCLRTPRVEEDALHAQARAMAEPLRRRGPDDYGTWADAAAGVALGHRRLSILDLSAAGHQPMVSACGRWVLVYNGEIYNFAALRRELEASGQTFRGHSDTEVLLAAIARWGVERALTRAHGMFAFGLWDRERRRLVLARDRVGKKPLYYGWSGDAFLFGSQLDALRAHPAFDAPIDRRALGLYVHYSWVPAPHSIFEGIRRLPPGTWLSLDPASDDAPPEPRAYWSARDVLERGAREPFDGSFEEATERLDALLRDAVGSRMVADVDLGALLSGGIDSSTVVSLMQSLSSRPVKTFSIGFREPEFDEAGHARAIARHLGTEHTELTVTAEDAMKTIPEIPFVYDEPLGDASQLPSVLLSRMARRDVTVALSGDGGDELFAGYTRYERALEHWASVRRLPPWLRRAQAAAMRRVARATWALLGAPSSSVPPSRALAAPPRIAPAAGWDKKASRVDVADLADVFWRRHARCPDPRVFVDGAAAPGGLVAWPDAPEPVAAMAYLDLTSFLVDDVLVKVDRASMAASLEVRCPLLDHRVIELAWSLPLSMRVDARGGKRVLREVLARYVPPALTERPKMGFGVPVSDWIRGPLRDWAEAQLDADRLRREGLLHADAVRRLWRQHLVGWRDHGSLLWSLLMFQAWHEARS